MAHDGYGAHMTLRMRSFLESRPGRPMHDTLSLWPHRERGHYRVLNSLLPSVPSSVPPGVLRDFYPRNSSTSSPVMFLSATTSSLARWRPFSSISSVRSSSAVCCPLSVPFCLSMPVAVLRTGILQYNCFLGANMRELKARPSVLPSFPRSGSNSCLSCGISPSMVLV